MCFRVHESVANRGSYKYGMCIRISVYRYIVSSKFLNKRDKIISIEMMHPLLNSQELIVLY